MTWLEGLDPATTQGAKSRIAEGLKSDPARWVRLALKFEVPFNREELAKKLETLRLSGGWNADEGGAYLLVELKSGKPERVAQFIAENRARLRRKQLHQSPELNVVEIQALARSGDTVSARKMLETKLAAAPVDVKSMLQTVIDECEGKVDPVTAARTRFEENDTTENLRSLCNALHKADQLDALVNPAMDLARRVRNVADLRAAVNLLMDRDRPVDALNCWPRCRRLGGVTASLRGGARSACFRPAIFRLHGNLRSISGGMLIRKCCTSG